MSCWEVKVGWGGEEDWGCAAPFRQLGFSGMNYSGGEESSRREQGAWSCTQPILRSLNNCWNGFQIIHLQPEINGPGWVSCWLTGACRHGRAAKISALSPHCPLWAQASPAWAGGTSVQITLLIY